MHVVNLDLLRALSAYHPDGSPKDPHARHGAELRALDAARRRAWWLRALAALRPKPALKVARR
jgi:hypothetical protein